MIVPQDATKKVPFLVALLTIYVYVTQSAGSKALHGPMDDRRDAYQESGAVTCEPARALCISANGNQALADTARRLLGTRLWHEQ